MPVVRGNMLFVALTLFLAPILNAGQPYLVKDINQTMGSAKSYPDHFVTIGSYTYFTTTDQYDVPRELYRTDGSAAGTIDLAVTGTAPVAFNGKAWFTTATDLWSTDGTVAGTQQFVLPQGVANPTRLMATSNGLYFYSPIDSNWSYLWRTDGTTAGTTQVSTTKFRIAQEPSDDYRSWTAIGATLFFVTTDDVNWTIWRTDGTTTAAAFPASGAYPIALQKLGNIVIFIETFPDGTGRYWRTDGTADGTYALSGTKPILYNGFFSNYVITGSAVYFTGSDGSGWKLWRSDGTNTGTTAVASSLPGASGFDASLLCALTNGTLILKGPALNPAYQNMAGLWSFDGTNTTFLTNIFAGTARGIAVSTGSWALYGSLHDVWRTDGTIGGTYALSGSFSGSDASHTWPMATLGSSVLFATFDGVGDLRKSDGNRGTDTFVKTIPGSTDGSYPQGFVRLNSGVLFTADDGSATRGLWFSDGTTAGTQKVLADSMFLGTPVTCGGRAYFPHKDAAGLELWSTDGTAAGTSIVADLDPGSDNGTPHSGNPGRMACIDNTLYFQAGDAEGTGLWRSDGRMIGTYKIRNIPSELETPVQYGHGFFFVSGRDLWVSNGTPEGTFALKTGSAPITGLQVAGNYLYFVLNDSSDALWRSNASVAGTTSVLTDSTIMPLGAFNQRMLFFRTALGTGYCTAGDAADILCFEVAPGNSTGFKVLNGKLYYNKPQVMMTPDSVNVTNTGLSATNLITTAGGRLYFIDSGYVTLRETDGTTGGTTTIGGPNLGTKPEVVEGGGRLFLSAYELFAYDLPVAALSMSPATLPASGGAVTLSGRGFIGPVSITVGGLPATAGAVSANSIAFTAPAHDPGTYTVTLTTGDGRIIDAGTPLAYTCTAPAAVISTSPATVCPKTQIQLHGSGGTQCHWYPITGLDNAASCTPVATVNAPVTYMLVVNDGTGCPSTNNPAVTLSAYAAPDATVTLSANFIEALKTYTASVPDAGPGGTYSWTATGGLSIGGDATQRTVTFNAGCAPGSLKVTVTNANGCAASSDNYVGVYVSPPVTSVTPAHANPGTVITVTGSQLQCVTGVTLIGPGAVTVPFTLVDPTTIRFTFPVNGALQSDVFLNTAASLVQTRFPLYRTARYNLFSDQNADILWRHPATGMSLVWAMSPDGRSFVTITPILRDSGTDYKIVGSHDLGGFPNTDILWQRTSTRALSSMDTFNGHPVSETTWPLIPGPTLNVAAIGDFNGDGLGEPLMRDTQTGATTLWTYYPTMPGVVQAPVHSGGNLDWKIVAVADFDLDGKDDILWRNTNSGMTLLWFMNGAAIRSSQVVHTGGNLDWTIAGVGDFDGDGKADILWRYTTGMTLIWLMNGTQIRSSTVVHSGANLNWTIAGIGDFNSDWKSDILWRENASGATLYWQMDGPQITTSILLHSGANLDWQLEGPRNP
ncbi:MAG TPA: FG-GAP-like repeat-containing protein [Thermoanaerobaculia bacterium]